jgi:uncharacterized damage-inducible protein DinB
MLNLTLPNLTGEQLLNWWERTSDSWRQLFTKYPGCLTLPCDIRESTSVAQLLQHIVGAELRYAERLHGVRQTPYDEVPFDSVPSIYAVHERARTLLLDLGQESENFWSEPVDFETRSAGVLRAPRRALFIHLIMHSIRHYAQLATLVRQNGIRPDWPMDYLFMELVDRDSAR